MSVDFARRDRLARAVSGRLSSRIVGQPTRENRLQGSREGWRGQLDKLLGFRVADDFPHGDAEAFRDPLERRHADILVAALQFAVIGAVHLDVIREGFLIERTRFSAPANRLANRFL